MEQGVATTSYAVGRRRVLFFFWAMVAFFVERSSLFLFFFFSFFFLYISSKRQPCFFLFVASPMLFETSYATTLEFSAASISDINPPLSRLDASSANVLSSRSDMSLTFCNATPEHLNNSIASTASPPGLMI